MLWPVTSLKRPRCPKRLRSKIGSNRRPRYLGASDTFLCYLLGYCYICTVRGAQNLSAIVSITGVYIDPLWRGARGGGNRFGRSYGLSGSYPSLIPFVLVVIVKWRISRDSSIPRLNLGRRKSEFIIGGKVTSWSEGIRVDGDEKEW